VNELEVAARFAIACGVIAVVLGTFWYVGKTFRRAVPGRARTIALLETVHLPNGASIHTIRAGSRTFAIGRSGSSLVPICEIPPASTTPEAGARGVAGSLS
jgi:flagellar biogenesis protein FliO